MRVQLVGSLVCAVLVTACSGGDGTLDEPSGGGSGKQSASASALPQGSEPFELDPASFTTDVDNEYFPLKPGTQWTYREVDAEDGSEQQVVVTVTSETKELANGVTARVVRDTVTEDGEIVEDTLDWYAQDADGNVWYLGEDTAEFEGGKVTSHAGAWEAGVDGALAGVIMPAEPRDGQSYRQEYLAGEAEDGGEVLATGMQAEAPAGHYDDVVITADTTGIEPDVLELKFYAPGIGTVLAIDASGGSAREELLRVEQVSDEVAERAGTAELGESYG